MRVPFNVSMTARYSKDVGWKSRSKRLCRNTDLNINISACGLRLEDEAIRVAVGLRLGVVICEPPLCPCGHQVDAKGSHCLACKRGIGRMQSHQLINDIVHRAFIRANIPATKEPAGLS